MRKGRVVLVGLLDPAAFDNLVVRRGEVG